MATAIRATKPRPPRLTPVYRARRNALLLLPRYQLVIGLDPETKRETEELAYDSTMYAEIRLPNRRDAFVWEGRVYADETLDTIEYRGTVRPATAADLAGWLAPNGATG